MWIDLGEYITNYCYSSISNHSVSKEDINKYNISKDNIKNIKNLGNSCKVIEIAIGKFFSVADYLKNYNPSIIDFTATDINPDNPNIVFDDVTNPDMNIYNGADIIYSIRPPQELQPYIASVVAKTGAILIIKPLFNEDLNINFPMKLVNYKKAVFYQSI